MDPYVTRARSYVSLCRACGEVVPPGQEVCGCGFPVDLTLETFVQASANRNEAYAAARRGYRADNPHVGRELCA